MNALSSPPVLEVEQLSVALPIGGRLVPVVTDISLKIAPGQALALVGESGCGKSITALALTGLPPPGAVVSGRIRLEGQDVLSLPPRARRRLAGARIGFAFQEPMTALHPTLTIGAQMSDTLRSHQGLGRRAARERAAELLDQVGIPPSRNILDGYVHQLSGGMRQRVMIAMAVSCGPALLIADEPTTALDVTIQAQVLDLLARMRRQLGLAMLYISHDLGVVADHCDQAIVMYAGDAVERGPARAMLAAPRHPYAAGLVAAIPGKAGLRRLPAIAGQVPALGDWPTGCRFAPRCERADGQCGQRPALADGDVAALLAAAAGAAVSAEPLLLASGLVKHFAQVQAVRGIDITVARGETFGIVGESGSGKSTAARLLLRLIEADAGQIRFQGQDLRALAAEPLRQVRRQMQMVFQDPNGSLNPRMTVAELVEEPMLVHGIGDAAQRRTRALALLDEVSLPAAALQRHPHQFSGGQRQRIAIARALATEPALIVADEPVSALDVSVQAQVLNLLLDLKERHHNTLVFISHDLRVVEFMCDRIAVMYLGEIVEVGPKARLFGAPAHPYTQALLGAVPGHGDRAAVAPLQGEIPSPAAPPSGCGFRTRCPHAHGLCATTAPPLRALADGHLAACHRLA